MSSQLVKAKNVDERLHRMSCCCWRLNDPFAAYTAAETHDAFQQTNFSLCCSLSLLLLGVHIDSDVAMRSHVTATVRLCLLRSASTATQRAAMSATTSLADTYQNSNYQQGRLLLLSAGRRFWSLSRQTSVCPQRRRTTCLLGEAFRTHHAASARSPLAVSYTHLTLPTIYSV